MRPPIDASTIVAGVAGHPVSHSLSPAVHNAWLAAAGINGVYVGFHSTADGFGAFARGMRGGVIRGVNVTAPFKQEALAIADEATEAARRAGSANLLLFDADGPIRADNTDGAGLLDALGEGQADFDPAAGPVVIFGAGGAGAGVLAALIGAGAKEIRLINRSESRAAVLAARWGERVRTWPPGKAAAALEGARCVINATSLGLGGGEGPVDRFDGVAENAVALDMVYRPLRTRFLEHAERAGLATVDGLAMLIAQARPSFAALFGRRAPDIDVRAVALAEMAVHR